MNAEVHRTAMKTSATVSRLGGDDDLRSSDQLEDASAADLIAAVAGRYRLRDLTIEEPEIEAIVRRIYEQGL